MWREFVNAISSERDLKISWVFKMTRYTNVNVRISEDQKDKLKKAFESNCKSITIILGLYDGRGLILGPNSPFKNIHIIGMIL